MIRTTIKTVLVALIPFGLMFFAACGGGDEPSPTAPTTQPLATGTDENKQKMEEYLAKLKSGENEKCEKLGAQAIAFIALSNQQNGGQGAQGIIGGQSLASIANSNDGNGCVDTLNQVLWNATRIKYQNGQPWINDIQSKIWLAKQLGPVLNRIQSRVGPAFAANGINPNTLLTTYRDDIGSFVRNYVVNRLGSSSGGISNELSVYGL